MIVPELIGYDVVCRTSGVIHAGLVAIREEAEAVSQQIAGSVVVPVVKNNMVRVGYRIPTPAA